MMHPKELSIKDFTYQLPESKIALYPLSDRDSSKLLIYRNGNLSTDIYKNLSDHLPKGALLVLNNTRVIEARIMFQKPSGGRIEIFCLEPATDNDLRSALVKSQNPVKWKCLVGGASKWKAGQVLNKTGGPGNSFELSATYAGKRGETVLVEFAWNSELGNFGEVLHYFGAVPLPPYLRRAPEEMDSTRYQTVYNYEPGSVAAPTAGLHFTPALFDRLESASIQTAFLTLHVGAGTFKPVKAAVMEEHHMHEEFIRIDSSTLRKFIDTAPSLRFAVGTTSLRTLETAYWIGVKLHLAKISSSEDLVIHQWDPYSLPDHIDCNFALETLAKWMEAQDESELITKTGILIAPGYRIRTVAGLITNFHQPESTLLLLVAALVGDQWKEIYRYALDNDFRFLSYGDGCLLFNPDLSSLSTASPA